MKTSKSSLFLMELIIAILFFALASAVCIQLFAKAHLLGQTTMEENHSLLMTQNMSEIFLGLIPQHYGDSTENFKEQMLSLLSEDETLHPIGISHLPDSSLLSALPEGRSTADFCIILSFNKDWEVCSYSAASFHVYFGYYGYKKEDMVYEAYTGVYRKVSGDTALASYEKVYDIEVVKHIPERRSLS